MDRTTALLCVAISLVSVRASGQQVTAVTFAEQPGVTFLPLRETATALGIPVEWDVATRTVLLKGRSFPAKTFRTLYDETKLFPIREFESLGAEVVFDPASKSVSLRHEGRELQVVQGPKRVEVSIADQVLRAWQGDLLVMETNVSSGRRGHSTPTGEFKAGPAKRVMHYSRLYDNSPMPWSVQVHGNIFIHGYRSVPPRPASHGCIRLPLRKKNAAKYFFEWVDLGTPVSIRRYFEDAAE